MENEIREVSLWMTVKGRTVKGVAKVNVATGNIDLSALHLDDDFLTEIVYYNDVNLGTVICIIENEVRYAMDDEDFHRCDKCGYVFYRDDLVYIDSRDMLVYVEFAEYYEGEYYLVEEFEDNPYRNEEGHFLTLHAPHSHFYRNLYWCDSCNTYVEVDQYYEDNECIFCHDKRTERVIEDYCESHTHTPVLFGDYKDPDSFVGLGFELEVDMREEDEDLNEETARGLCSACGLDEDAMRYAHDGSLNYGFECISQPHTVKAFWEKQESWAKMLKYLSDKGYKSHDAKTCGLHVHVSRGMFGATEEEQNTAIAKIYTFFDENWDDLVKVSRRKNFTYCEKNQLDTYDMSSKDTKYTAWKKQAKGQGGHYVALNNKNRYTFEYRMGRGTLNAWSFFSWIDLVLTLTKNAKRITVSKVESNDLVSWLGGIKESTAKYIFKRGAFRKEMIALYPNIEWETDLTDSADC